MIIFKSNLTTFEASFINCESARAVAEIGLSFKFSLPKFMKHSV